MQGDPAAFLPADFEPLCAPDDQDLLDEFGVESGLIGDMGTRWHCFENELGDRLVMVIDPAERVVVRDVALRGGAT